MARAIIFYLIRFISSQRARAVELFIVRSIIQQIYINKVKYMKYVSKSTQPAYLKERIIVIIRKSLILS